METYLASKLFQMTKHTVKIRLADWTRFPGGRFKVDGQDSGEEFRETFLENEVAAGSDFQIDFNGIFTVGWSFLDESLGYYVKKLGESEFRQRFQIIADDDPDIPHELETVIKQRAGKN
jgi:STAS-like domain of unknown function (DUF4325)